MIMHLYPFIREIFNEDYKGDEYFRGVSKKLKEMVVVFMEGN